MDLYSWLSPEPRELRIQVVNSFHAALQLNDVKESEDANELSARNAMINFAMSAMDDRKGSYSPLRLSC